MTTTRRGQRRLAALTGLCVTVALVSASNVAAYPVTPEGEPLYAESVPTSAPATEVPGNVVPITATASNGTDWSAVIAVAAGASVAALAVLAAALILTGLRRRSAGAH